MSMTRSILIARTEVKTTMDKMTTEGAQLSMTVGGSSDEEEVAKLHRERQEERRLMWLQNHFIHHLLAVEGVDGDDSDDVVDDQE